MNIQVRKIGPVEVPLPSYQTEGSAGLDLCAAIQSPIAIEPGERLLVATGLQMAIPLGFEGQVRPRSGLSLRYGVTVLNSPGTVDSDYRGELKVLLINHGSIPFEIAPLDRIAQLVICPVARVQLVLCEELSDTDRGAGGYGSTGTGPASKREAPTAAQV